MSEQSASKSGSTRSYRSRSTALRAVTDLTPGIAGLQEKLTVDRESYSMDPDCVEVLVRLLDMRSHMWFETSANRCSVASHGSFVALRTGLTCLVCNCWVLPWSFPKSVKPNKSCRSDLLSSITSLSHSPKNNHGFPWSLTTVGVRRINLPTRALTSTTHCSPYSWIQVKKIHTSNATFAWMA